MLKKICTFENAMLAFSVSLAINLTLAVFLIEKQEIPGFNYDGADEKTIETPAAEESTEEAPDLLVIPGTAPDKGMDKKDLKDENVADFINRIMKTPGYKYRYGSTGIWCFPVETVQELIDKGYERGLSISDIEIWLNSRNGHFFFTKVLPDRKCIFYWGLNYGIGERKPEKDS